MTDEHFADNTESERAWTVSTLSVVSQDGVLLNAACRASTGTGTVALGLAAAAITGVGSVGDRRAGM